VRLTLEGHDDPIELTWLHRLYSEDAAAWLPAGELRPGASLRTRTAPVRIESIEPTRPAQRVYNIHVQHTHCFYVADAGVLSHNTESCVKGFRAVSGAEMNDIQKLGRFRPNPNQMGNKWFWEARESAEEFLTRYDDLEFIVEADIPRSVYDASFKAPRLDGIGGAFSVSEDMLDVVQPFLRQ
jgi:hypothetical protein